MRVLFLDDDANRWYNFRDHHIDERIARADWAKSYNAALDLCALHKYDVLCLDHDLSDFNNDDTDCKEMTGQDFAQWFCENMDYQPQVIIHSYNHSGAMNMKQIFHNAGFERVQYLPFDYFS